VIELVNMLSSRVGDLVDGADRITFECELACYPADAREGLANWKRPIGVYKLDLVVSAGSRAQRVL
jgi:hypothetical protein